ncbi:AraC family transcriptional regulator [Sphingobacterium bambusae]|uniref:Helix-turn-helix domain-containing protein n=1 Tax=Sphingobacterium bambusae TaxID=662858 RepID=A0ABW6BLS1_9SPHI|nr:AraC family transcriptional regulator [Sphingobacterium bambusae]WPL47731.1 AraC family transcriptional regulator [Sphingobacterium bambusae]
MLKITTFRSVRFPDLVERFWFLENDDQETIVYHPPEPYINLRISWFEAEETRPALNMDDPFWEGLPLQHVRKCYLPHTRQLGVRFYPYGAYPFFGGTAQETIDALARFKDLVVGFMDGMPISDRKVAEELDVFLAKYYVQELYRRVAPLQLFYRQVRWDEDPPDIQRFCQQQGLYYTALNRVFRRVLGVSPKKFERLVKFRRALCDLLDSEHSLSLIGHAAGYFDQAHFIREFKAFSDITPSTYQQLMCAERLLQYNFRFL